MSKIKKRVIYELQARKYDHCVQMKLLQGEKEIKTRNLLSRQQSVRENEPRLSPSKNLAASFHTAGVKGKRYKMLALFSLIIFALFNGF